MRPGQRLKLPRDKPSGIDIVYQLADSVVYQKPMIGLMHQIDHSRDLSILTIVSEVLKDNRSEK
jgi:hypothetical protein